MAINNSINNTCRAGITVSNGDVNMSVDAVAGAVNIGTGAAQKIVQIGSTNTTSATVISGGSSGVTVVSGTGTIGVGVDATASSVNIGTGAGNKTVTVGSTNTTSTTTIRAGSGNIILSGGIVVPIAVTSSTPYVVTDSDYSIFMNSSGGARTVQLPDAPNTGRTFVIKDSNGSANTNNITITTVGGAVNIDGATTFVMNSQYESVSVIFNGSSYMVV